MYIFEIVFEIVCLLPLDVYSVRACAVDTLLLFLHFWRIFPCQGEIRTSYEPNYATPFFFDSVEVSTIAHGPQYCLYLYTRYYFWNKFFPLFLSILSFTSPAFDSMTYREKVQLSVLGCFLQFLWRIYLVWGEIRQTTTWV